MCISDWSSDVCSSDLGLPKELGGATMNRFCGSSMYAIHVAAGQIAMGAGDAFIAGGVESMTMVPQGGFNFSPNPRFAFDGQPGTDQFYDRSEEHTSELQSLMRISYAVFCLKQKKPTSHK